MPQWFCILLFTLLSPSPPTEEDSGFRFEGLLTLDALRINPSDGSAIRGLADLNLIFQMDTEGLGWWRGGTFSVFLLGDLGDDPSAELGDLQGINNIEAEDTAKLYEFWYEHRLFSDQLGILLGLHDLNSEFYVLESAGEFIQSSFGIGPDMSQATPSIFPTTALGLRLAVERDNWNALAAVYDGVPGDPDDPRGTHIILKSEDGLFLVAEGGFQRSSYGEPGYLKGALGVWRNTAPFRDIQDRQRDRNHGIYGIFEMEMRRDLHTFFQVGTAPHGRNEVESYLGVGLTHTNLFRSGDQLGVAAAQARMSSDLREDHPSVAPAETVLELIYSLPIGKNLALSPDVQYLINLGADRQTGNSWVWGLRLKLSF